MCFRPRESIEALIPTLGLGKLPRVEITGRSLGK